ncbi:hypothetical protein SAMN04488061_3258 [Filomicrobium insigne]|uniref:Uncharacterized protein n=1 Tax=Filomicrobium insigne TaxID=418854 RepID=A0A1H0TDC7_9HYPH|nr:hypothetical protein SAMN04488061_3258 [Filomicrobium insigne]
MDNSEARQLKLKPTCAVTLMKKHDTSGILSDVHVNKASKSNLRRADGG